MINEIFHSPVPRCKLVSEFSRSSMFLAGLARGFAGRSSLRTHEPLSVGCKGLGMSVLKCHTVALRRGLLVSEPRQPWLSTVSEIVLSKYAVQSMLRCAVQQTYLFQTPFAALLACKHRKRQCTGRSFDLKEATRGILVAHSADARVSLTREVIPRTRPQCYKFGGRVLGRAHPMT